MAAYLREGGTVVGLPSGERSIAALLSKRKYATGMFGKDHTGLDITNHPTSLGFRAFVGFRGAQTWSLPLSNGPQNPNMYRGFERYRETRYFPQAFTAEARKFIRRHRKKPFLLYVPFNLPHHPFHWPPGPYRKLVSPENPDGGPRHKYLAMIAALDAFVGRILKELRKQRLEKHTLVFFINDNGGDVRLEENNGVFRGGKGTLYEGGIRVPFLAQWKGVLQRGSAISDRCGRQTYSPRRLLSPIQLRPNCRVVGFMMVST